MTTDQSVSNLYLESATALFSSYKLMAEKAMAQLKEEEINFKKNDDSNSIAIIVKHLHGNMLSRWTDFLIADGEKPWRKRDEEFEGTINSITELLKIWEEGWNQVFDTLKKLTAEDLTKTIYIRNAPLSVIDSINRQMMHYGTHIGQIIFIAKELRGSSWVSLTIPKKK